MSLIRIGKMLVLQKLSRGLTLTLLRRTSSSAVTSAAKLPADSPDAPKQNESDSKKPRSSLVAAAFQSLKTDDSAAPEAASPTQGASHSSLDEKIMNAKTVNGLLAITDIGANISRKHALKVVSILAEWSSINRVKLSEFENDARFIKLCRLLGRAVPKNSNGNNQGKSVAGFRTDDLNTVLGIAGDDEAAKLVASISITQMVKVMAALAQRKRRSTPLLRSLAFNISSSSEVLDLKQCSDVLYAMASLNFPDPVLTAKVTADVQAGLPSNTDKPAAVGSILTSLGMLKYRDLDLLESLVNWTLKNHEICRPQDLNALFLTMATLNFKSTSINEIKSKLVPALTADDYGRSSDWLGHVWSLTLQGLSDENRIASVLKDEFIEKLESEKGGLTPTMKMKLLNINASAKHLLGGYKGPFLKEDGPVFSVPMAHNKSKQIIVNGMLDALKSLLSSSTYVKTLVDSKMGFLIDAECLLDAKCNPLPVDKNQPGAVRVAIMVVDFHDICQGTHRSISGVTHLSFDLLEKCGYKIISVPYNEFSTSEKLLKRVQYLEGKLKRVVKDKN
ncbi:unnamed protein product [Hermetia illucens]|uniref:RAP domain-containing protein n=1 Tax=Hermetia illucens TaxID=343691 RepID=A0A7R8V0G7_HERIL|nr:FAST kinase domain-containing protein 4 [Hermetia illucens]CAD7090388.1 unnamed protein product [Hermetia illucens]